MARRERTIFSIHDGASLTGLVAEDVVMLEIVQQGPAGYGGAQQVVRTPIVVSLADFTGLAAHLAEQDREQDTEQRTSAEER